MKTVITLDPVGLQPLYAALVLCSPTGVVYRHQCGGTSCRQLEAEGALVPLSQIDLAETAEADALRDADDLTQARHLKAAQALCAAHVPVFTPGGDAGSREGSAEAFLVGRVKTTEPWNALPAGLDCPAVLLWDNTD